MTSHHDELERLVAAEPTATGSPDLTAIRHAGRRLRTRRRIVTGLASLAVVGAIGVPTALVASGGPEATTPDPAGPASAGQEKTRPRPKDVESRTLEDLLEDTEPSVCGVMACRFVRPAEYTKESGTVVGEVLPMGTFDGGTEVLYVARLRGVDLRTSKDAEVDVLMAGIDDGQTLRRTVWAVQPGTEPGDPDLRLYGGSKAADADGEGHHYGVIGYIAGEHNVVEVTLPDGTTRPVSGSSTGVLPGWTAFYDTGAWFDEWESRADLTYGVPGGPSCSTLTCGSIG